MEQVKWDRNFIQGTFSGRADEAQKCQRLIESVVALHRLRGDSPVEGNRYVWISNHHRPDEFLVGFADLNAISVLNLQRVPPAVQEVIDNNLLHLFTSEPCTNS